MCFESLLLFFFFHDTAPTEIYTLSLHDALPICAADPPGELLLLPWCRGKDQGETAAYHAGGRAQGRRVGAGSVAGQAKRELAAPGPPLHLRRSQDAAQGQAAADADRCTHAVGEYGRALVGRGREGQASWATDGECGDQEFLGVPPCAAARGTN